MSEGRCPITYNYLRALYDYFRAGVYAELYDDDFNVLRDMLRRCKSLPEGLISSTVQKLRAFYCLEVLQEKVVHSIAICTEEPRHLDLYPRTDQGLKQLLEEVEGLERELVVSTTQMDLMGQYVGSTQPDVSGLLRRKSESIRVLFPELLKLGTELRTQLKRSNPEFGPIGTAFYEGIVPVSLPGQMVQYGQDLLNISETNGIIGHGRK